MVWYFSGEIGWRVARHGAVMGRRLKHKRAEPPKTAPIWPGRPPGPGRGGFAPRGRQGAPDEAGRTVVATGATRAPKRKKATLI